MSYAFSNSQWSYREFKFLRLTYDTKKIPKHKAINSIHLTFKMLHISIKPQADHSNKKQFNINR